MQLAQTAGQPEMLLKLTIRAHESLPDAKHPFTADVMAKFCVGHAKQQIFHHKRLWQECGGSPSWLVACQEEGTYPFSPLQHDPEVVILQFIQLLIKSRPCQSKVYEDWPAGSMLHQDVLWLDIVVNNAVLVDASQCSFELLGQLPVAVQALVPLLPLQHNIATIATLVWSRHQGAPCWVQALSHINKPAT